MRFWIWSILCLLRVPLTAQETKFTIVEENANRIIIDIQFGKMESSVVKTNQGDQLKMHIQGGTPLLQMGFTELPKVHFSLQIPNEKNTTIKILHSKYTDQLGYAIAPSKGSMSRTIKPNDVPFVYNELYQKNAFYPAKLAYLNEPYILRHRRGQTVHVLPAQYNPISKTLRIYEQMRIQIDYEGLSTINTLSSDTHAENEDVFASIYQNRFINYKPESTSYAPISEQGNLLIVTPSVYLPAMQAFIQWKNQKGIKTLVALVDTISGGVSDITIKNCIKKYFQNFGIQYVLLVGDNTDIPSIATGFDIKGPSDRGYAYMVGSDHYPDLIVGRFSGESLADISTQVERSIAYEKIPNAAGNWMRTQLGIASQEGTGDDNQMDWEHIHAIVDSNKSHFNYTHNIEMYDGDTARIGTTDISGWPDISMFKDSVNEGVSLINYCGHGSVSGIQTTSFSSTDVPLLQNYQKLPFLFVVGCRPGYFDSFTCFAEVMQRAQDASGAFGSVASFMSTIDQYWDEPMEAQDEFNSILQGARVGNDKMRIAPICMDACMAMNDAYNIAPDFDANDMTDTWVFFGDPTLALYSKNEGQISISHATHIHQNDTYFEVFSPVDGATIGLYYQGAYLTSATVIGGKASLSFSAIAGLDTVYITATKPNWSPAFGKSIVTNWVTGLDNSLQLQNIAVYPNPTEDVLQIVSKSNASLKQVEVIDMLGKVCARIPLQNHQCTLSTKMYSPGMYTLRIQTTNGKNVVTTFTKR